jgi:hypothetical protein
LGATLGGLVGYATTMISSRRRRPFVSWVDFVRAAPAYDFGPVDGGPAYYGSGDLYKMLIEIAGRDAPGFSTLEMTYEAPSGDNWRRYAKWDEAPNPLSWTEPGQFWPALVPSGYQQVLQFRRIYAVPIVWASKERRLMFSGWLFGKDRYTSAEPDLDPQGRITLTLAGQGLHWTGTIGVKELMLNAPQLYGADSDDKQDNLQRYADERRKLSKLMRLRHYLRRQATLHASVPRPYPRRG